MGRYGRAQTYFANHGWYTVVIKWRNHDNSRGEYHLTGLDSDFTLGFNKYDVYVEGPGGTHWDIQDGEGHTYRWYGPIWDQRISGPGYDDNGAKI